MKVLPVVLAFVAVVAIGCGQIAQLTPAPEVEITFLTPVAGVYLGVDSLKIDQIEFRVFNHVDAIITSLEYDYLKCDKETPLDSLCCLALHLIVSGEADSASELLNVPVPLTVPVVAYLAADSNAVARLTFRGEDAYGLEKTFDVVVDWGIQAY